MWKRGSRDEEHRTSVHDAVPGLGVGVQVYVRESDRPCAEDWVGEPTGVIVAPGDRSLRNVYGPVDGLTTWTVAFFEPQHRRDGRGPYERAVIPASLLVTAEPVPE